MVMMVELMDIVKSVVLRGYLDICDREFGTILGTDAFRIAAARFLQDRKGGFLELSVISLSPSYSIPRMVEDDGKSL